MTQLRAALFDFDGTLCDSFATIARLIAQSCQHIGVPIPEADRVRANIGRGLLTLAEDYTGGDKGLAEQLFHTYRALNAKEISTRNRTPEPLYEGAYDAVASLQAEGWLTAIVTNKGRAGLDYLIEAHQLSGLFDVTLTIDEVTGKPAPDMAIEAMRRLGTDPAETVLVGDTLSDAGCASAARIAFAGVSWGCQDISQLQQAGAAIILPDFADISSRLASVLGGR